MSHLRRAFLNRSNVPKIVGTSAEVLKQIRDIEKVNEIYALMMKDVKIPVISFNAFIQTFYDMTPVSMNLQPFYCALMHSVTLTYISRHFLEAIARFPYVKNMCMAGGVACNEFFS